MAPPLRIEIHDIGPARPLRRTRFSVPDPITPGAARRVMPGSFTPGAIVEACRQGVVASPHPDAHGRWFSPDPRTIIVPRNLRMPDDVDRAIRAGDLYVSLDAAFERVLAGCAEHAEGNWITAEYRRAYSRLHQLGWAHSFEVWTVGGELVGGLYGLNMGGLFSIESTFQTVPDASNIAMVTMAQHVQDVGVTLVDARVMTPDLTSMGAVTIPRSEFLEWVRAVLSRPVAFAGERCEPGAATIENLALFSTSL